MKQKLNESQLVWLIAQGIMLVGVIVVFLQSFSMKHIFRFDNMLLIAFTAYLTASILKVFCPQNRWLYLLLAVSIGLFIYAFWFAPFF